MDRIRQQFKDIADMIRLRNGTTDSISASEMPELIRTLGGAQFIADSIVDTEKGTQTLAISTYKPPFIPVSCDPVFANNSWETIAKVSAQISAENMTSADVYSYYGWSLGDSKDIDINGTIIPFIIIGYNHKTLQGSTTTAGITLWATKPYSSSQPNGRWAASNTTRPWMNSTLLSYFPTDLQLYIKPVINKSLAWEDSSSLDTTNDKLFVLAAVELGVPVSSWSGGINQYWRTEGSTFEYFLSDAANKAAVPNNQISGITMYYTRTLSSKSNYQFCINSIGTGIAASSFSAYGNVIAFCI